MNASRLAIIATATLATSAAGLIPASSSLVINRWLVSEVFPGDSAASENRLDDRYLEAPGEQGVLPDRGMPAAGTVWRLLRNDGAERMELDPLLESVAASSIVFAHAYVRLPEDRTLGFAWTAEPCMAGRAWLNGRKVANQQGRVRFGAGWNTILLKLEVGECVPAFGATIESETEEGLAGIRIQASRPPGEVRTGPEPWVTIGDEAVISGRRTWTGDRLYAEVEVPLTGWGRSPVPGVEVRLEGPVEGRSEALWLTPGEGVRAAVLVRTDRLQRLSSGTGLDIKVEWDGGSVERLLEVTGATPPASDTLVLEGWRIGGPGANDLTRRTPGQLPPAGDWTLSGKWKIPADLDMKKLTLLVDQSPGAYMIGSRVVEEGPAVLCEPCRKGTEYEIVARSSGPWQRIPPVVIGP